MMRNLMKLNLARAAVTQSNGSMALSVSSRFNNPQNQETVVDKTKDMLHNVAEKTKDTLNSAKDKVANAAEKTKDFYNEKIRDKGESFPFEENAEEKAGRKIRNATHKAEDKIASARERSGENFEDTAGRKIRNATHSAEDKINQARECSSKSLSSYNSGAAHFMQMIYA